MTKRRAHSRRKAESDQGRRRRRITKSLVAGALVLTSSGVTATASRASTSSQTLVVWSFQGASSTPTSAGGVPYAFYLINKNFEKAYPNVKVDMVLEPFNDYRPLFAAAAAAQSGPDVWESLPGEYTYQYASELQPLNKYITPAFKSSLTGWSGVIEPEWSTSGTIYGIPSETQGNTWYYNKALFKKAGITTPPATFAELLADCKKLEAHGITPLANGTADDQGAINYINNLLEGLVPASEMVGLADGKLSWTSPGVEEALQLMENLAPYYEKGYTGLLYEGPGSDLFPGGHTAMIPGLLSNNNNYFQFEQALGKNNVGLFRTPTVPGYQKYSHQMGEEADYSWTVTKWAHDTTAAVDYAKFMESAASQKILLDDGGDIPNLKSVPSSWFSGTPAQIETLLKTSVGTHTPGSLMDSALSTYFGQQMDDVFTGSESVSSAAKNIQSDATSGA
jgi:ABC-type glycerol-3-phosphate transport system substrate-binding protein